MTVSEELNKGNDGFFYFLSQKEPRWKLFVSFIRGRIEVSISKSQMQEVIQATIDDMKKQRAGNGGSKEVHK